VTEVTTSAGALQVLVIDDSISTRALISRALEQAGYDVRQAADGAEALGTLSAAEFDVIITDQWMPNMTGVEFVRAVREDPRFEGLPILAVTTDGEDDVRTEFMEAGASACILKPFATNDLIETVTQVTRG
jgi:two-component system chemotaxis response regulator CheY